MVTKMDVCTDRRCSSGLSRSPTELKMKLCYPLITRRPATSYSSRQAFNPSPRIHSANPRINMATTPRSNVVSTAGFYDWSTEDVGESSMSNIYRKLAVNHKNRVNTRTNKNWCTDGIHVNPGRMFIRDKADLTKGEREIIAGIYKNRGDINKENGRNGIVTHIKSHTDAWLVGKQITKKGNPIEIEKCSFKIPDSLFSKPDPLLVKNDAQCDTTSDTDDKYMCDKCKENCLHHKFEQEVKLMRTQKAGRTAPPSSPSHSPSSSRRERKSQTVKPEGGVFVESGKTFFDPEEGSKKKKVFVDVFLPKFPMQAEMTSVSIQQDVGTDVAERKHESFSKNEHKDNRADKLSKLSSQKLGMTRQTPRQDNKNYRKSTSLSSSRSNSSTGE